MTPRTRMMRRPPSVRERQPTRIFDALYLVPHHHISSRSCPCWLRVGWRSSTAGWLRHTVVRWILLTERLLDDNECTVGCRQRTLVVHVVGLLCSDVSWIKTVQCNVVHFNYARCQCPIDNRPTMFNNLSSTTWMFSRIIASLGRSNQQSSPEPTFKFSKTVLSLRRSINFWRARHKYPGKTLNSWTN